MPENKAIYDLTHQVGKLTGIMETNVKVTESNTATVKVLNDYMQQNIGASAQRDRSYKRMTHFSIAGLVTGITGLAAALKAWFHA